MAVKIAETHFALKNLNTEDCYQIWRTAAQDVFATVGTTIDRRGKALVHLKLNETKLLSMGVHHLQLKFCMAVRQLAGELADVRIEPRKTLQGDTGYFAEVDAKWGDDLHGKFMNSYHPQWTRFL